MSENYFEIFDLPIDYEINFSDLDSKYYNLLKICHPDHNLYKDSLEKLANTQKSLLINDAYKTLKSPILRVEYLLKLKNITLDENSNIKPDPMLLMEIMELREELISADKDTIKSIKEKTDQIINISIEKFNYYYKLGEIENSAHEFIKLKYYDKLLAEIKLKNLAIK